MINIKKFLLNIVLFAKLPSNAKQAIRKLNSSSICIDAGANAGSISEFFAKSGALVYSFEPDSLAFEKLQSNTIKYSNIIIEKKAVGTENVRKKLYKHKQSSSSGSVDFSQASSLMIEIVQSAKVLLPANFNSRPKY